MKKIAVVLFGTPGSGKGMQAELLVTKYGLTHVDTGSLLRSILFNKALQKKDPEIRKEAEINAKGILNSSNFVLKLLKKHVSELAQLGQGVVFSGSPRTLFEAEGLVPLLEKLYGRKNVFMFLLDVPAAAAAKRNAVRLVCSTCRRPLLAAFYPSKNPKQCPVCGGKLMRRVDDAPEKYRTRALEYATRTKPVMTYARARGYTIKKLDGSPAPYLIFGKIVKTIGE